MLIRSAPAGAPHVSSLPSRLRASLHPALALRRMGLDPHGFLRRESVPRSGVGDPAWQAPTNAIPRTWVANALCKQIAAMSWLKALVAMSVLALSLDASAGGRVDWSDYIDHDAKPSAPVGSASGAAPAPISAAPKKAKATKVSKKKVATKSRKARAKKSRRK
jgi:hypothetical protein